MTSDPSSVFTALPPSTLRRAFIHAGFHKTGTTLLQTGVRSLFRRGVLDPARLHFSSQHGPGGEWLPFRTSHFLPIRNRLIQAALSGADARDRALSGMLDGTILAEKIDRLRAYLDADTPCLLHSDENTLGFPFGHRNPIFKEAPAGFYPGAEAVISLLARLLTDAGFRVELVLTVRNFEASVVSSFKDSVKLGKSVARFSEIETALRDLPDRHREIITASLEDRRIAKLHVIDASVNQLEAEAYLKRFLAIAVGEAGWSGPLKLARNRSSADEKVFAALRASPNVDPALGAHTSIADCFSNDFRVRMRTGYSAFQTWISGAAIHEPRLDWVT